MIEWGKAFRNSLKCLGWSAPWLLLGSPLIIIGIVLSISNYTANTTQELYRFIFSEIGGFIAGFGVNAAFFKIFPNVVYDSEINWRRALEGSAKYQGWSILFSIPNIILSIIRIILQASSNITFSSLNFLPSIFAGIGSTAAYFKIFPEIMNDIEIEWGRAWKGSAKIFGYTLLWSLLGGSLMIIAIIPTRFSPVSSTISFIVFIIILLIGLFIALLGSAAAYFKVISEIITDKEYIWERCYKASAIFISWTFLWIIVGGLIILIGYLPIINYHFNPPIFIPEMELLLNSLILPIISSIIGGFVLALGILAVYIKIFGELIQED
ncbi:MAG: hypothetical protein ACFFCM_04145 [Promethearchaeota archaeon]